MTENRDTADIPADDKESTLLDTVEFLVDDEELLFTTGESWAAEE